MTRLCQKRGLTLSKHNVFPRAGLRIPSAAICDDQRFHAALTQTPK
jgi:hypothetical protein